MAAPEITGERLYCGEHVNWYWIRKPVLEILCLAPIRSTDSETDVCGGGLNKESLRLV